MSIIIKGMEMPENCDDCLLGADCPHDQRMDGYKMQGGRPRTCPLVPVPQHGRLIDADDFFRNFPELLPYEFAAPTIIPAEEGE